MARFFEQIAPAVPRTVHPSTWMFALGYYRHHQLLFPSFPPNHLRSVMAENTGLYLEGVLLHEPEKLPNRSRWYLRAQRIWHAAGAEEISGDLLLNVRQLRREW